MQLSINGVPLIVTLADDDSSRIEGLMNTPQLDMETGLLFRWPDSTPRSFWMKDTSIPLDIAYISDTGDILNIEEMEPFSLKSVISNGPATCALEVNRGWFRENGVKQGDHVSGVFNDIPKLSDSVILEQAEFRLPDDDFYYNDTVDAVVSDIIRILPVKMPIEETEITENIDYDWNYPIDPDSWEENWESAPAFFEIELKVIPEGFSDDHPGWNIDANAGWGGAGASIEVEVQFRPGLEIDTKTLITLENELSNVIAHEIHHLTQHDGPLERPNCSVVPPSTTAPAGYYDYFTSACEIPAFLIGFRAESSKTGRPTEELIRSYLENQVAAGLITTKEADDITSRWMNHSVWDKQQAGV
jgi:uncharacterized membrane protein (UPF0127 family)